MKRSLLAIAVSASLAAPGLAVAHTELYGKINLSLDKVEPNGTVVNWTGLNSDQHQWQLNSNESYLGVRGAADLDVGDLQVIYQLEYETAVDNGKVNALNTNGTFTTDTFIARNSFLGLKGGFGTLKAGRFDTPLREMGDSVDQFHDQLYADIFNLMAGEWRADNMLAYSTPQIANMLTFNVSTVVPEQNDVNGSGVQNTELFDSFSTSVVLDMDAFKAGLAYDHNNYADTLQNGVDMSAVRLSPLSPVALGAPSDIIRLMGSAYLDVIEVGVLLQQAESTQDIINGNKEKERSWLVSAGLPLGALKLKAQYGETDPKEVDNAKLTQYSLGADYMLGKQTKAYLYGSHQEFDGDRTFAVAGVGMEHRF